MLNNILTIVGVALLIVVLYRGIKGNSQAFSRENLSKSFTTLGLLGIGLIALVALTILFLKR